MTLVRFFDEPSTLDEVGGKAVNLSRLSRAGFPVPPGFAVTTEAFRTAVHEHGLRDLVNEALAGADPDNPDSVDDASVRIRAAFAAAPVTTLLTEPVAQAMLDAYRQMGGGAVAVRSSATAEDLPDLSFAGQQDTLLGVTDEAALLKAVVECWSSLWTARAITYRRRAGIPEEAAALAVAVQRMVAADTSGVLFTANPLTGHRGQMAIDATFGLGEALVSGLVEPDHFVADAVTGRLLARTLGDKAVTTAPLPGGGVETRDSDRGAEATLSDDEVRALVDLGRRVQAEYGTPQDIEWAIAGGEVALLQARAITSLFPIPDGAPTDAVYLSFGAVQGMLAPITPLGGDAIRCVMAGGASVFGSTLEPESNPYIGTAGERLWIRLDRALRNPLGSRVLPGLLKAVDPSARRILLDLREEGVLTPLPREAMRAVAPKLARFARVAGRNLARAVRDPQTLRAEFDEVTEAAVPPRHRGLRRHERRAGRVPPRRTPSADPPRHPVRRLPDRRALRGRRHRRPRPRAPGAHPALRRHRRGRPRRVPTRPRGHPRAAAQRHHRDGPGPLAGRPDGPRRPRVQPSRRRPESGRARGPVCVGRALPRGHRRPGRLPRRIRDARDRRDRPRAPAVERRPGRRPGDGAAVPGHPGGPVATGAVRPG